MALRLRSRRMHAARATAAAVLAASSLAACGDTSEPSTESAAQMDSVTVQLPYVPSGNSATFYVADKLGYFKEQGIELKAIQPGKGSALAMQIVGHGKAEFGFGDLPTLATARSQGIPVVALTADNQTSPLAMCSFEDKHPLTTPQAMKGLRMGVSPAGSTFVFYKALLQANGMTRADLKEFTVTQPYENYLLQEKVDIITCYVDTELPVVQAHAGDRKISVLLGSDWGYDVLGSGLFTSEEMIRDNPDLVQRFVTAYANGFRYVFENPAEAAKILGGVSTQTKGQESVYETQIRAAIETTNTSPTTEEHGLGYMTEEAWQSTVTILSKTGTIKKGAEVGTPYDNSFIAKVNGG